MNWCQSNERTKVTRGKGTLARVRVKIGANNPEWFGEKQIDFVAATEF